MVFKAAVCPNCAGELQLPDDKDTVKCMYCGSNIVVRQAIEKASGVNTKNLMSLAKAAIKSENYNEAYKYYSQVLEVDIDNIDAWIGKGLAATAASTIQIPRHQEMVSCMESALDHLPEDKKEQYTSQIVAELYDKSMMYHKYYRNWLDNIDGILTGEYVTNLYGSYLSGSKEALNGLELAHKLSPQDENIIDAIINICTLNLSSFRGNTLLPEYEKPIREKLQHFVAIKQEKNPTYKPPNQSGCFVVTATTGSYNDPNVKLLQEFREKWLLNKKLGVIFNSNYEIYGPYLADIIRERKLLRYLSLFFIVKPSAFMASIILGKNK